VIDLEIEKKIQPKRVSDREREVKEKAEFGGKKMPLIHPFLNLALVVIWLPSCIMPHEGLNVKGSCHQPLCANLSSSCS
jgi:hypothetical protein